MCKHKSGGMSKPSEAATQQGGLVERSNASFSSLVCPQETNNASASQNPALVNSEIPYNSEMRNFTAIPVFPNEDNLRCSQDAHNFLPNDETVRFAAQQKYENISYMSNVLQETNEPEYSDFDDDTEQSPMLLKEAYTDPNVLSNAHFNKNTLKPKYYHPCGPYMCTDVEGIDKRNITDCDNFSLYNSFQTQSTFQESASYAPQFGSVAGSSNFFRDPIDNFNETCLPQQYNYLSKTRKKWFMNQKCKSADEPDALSRHISSICRRSMPLTEYNYNQSVETSLSNDCGHYFKSAYSNVTDPIAGPSGLQRPSSINWEIEAQNRDEEFRSRSYSLTPTINFAVFESESSSETEDTPQEPILPEAVDIPVINEICTKTLDDPFELPILSLGKVIPISSSAAQLSIASSYGDNGSPICKICHMTAKENDPLISPCRCSGTMQYIHCGCLMRWLEVCNKRSRKPASCELCQYQYHWHKKFKIRHWQLPPCSRKDKILHLLFFVSLMLMVICASITVLCFKQDKGTRVDPDRTELTHSEIVTLICGVLFFLAFFVAMYVEVKSHNTLYQLLVKFIRINQQWYIDEYEKKEAAPVAV